MIYRQLEHIRDVPDLVVTIFNDIFKSKIKYLTISLSNSNFHEIPINLKMIFYLKRRFSSRNLIYLGLRRPLCTGQANYLRIHNCLPSTQFGFHTDQPVCERFLSFSI